MKQYKIVVFTPQGWDKEYTSPSRNAKQHILNHFAGTSSAQCNVYTMQGKQIGAAMIDCTGKKAYNITF